VNTFWIMMALDFAVTCRACRRLIAGRIEMYRVLGQYGVWTGAVGISGLRAGLPTAWVAYMAASTALSLWMWWKGGGGDDTKWRLRKLGRAFTGTRRTAPAGA